MVKVPSAPNAAFRRSEKFRVHLLLVLGIAFLGTAVTIIGLAGSSPAIVAIGAGAIAAAGLISIFFAAVSVRELRRRHPCHSFTPKFLSNNLPNVSAERSSL
jgi:hypothetical protein